MDTLQIKLMYKEAIIRLDDAEILSKDINRESNSDYLLQLLAFELLLKAVALIHTGRFNQNHNYRQLFESLPGNISDQLMARATHWSEKFLTKREIQELLMLYRNNFVRLRYPFEAYKKMNESEYLDYGNLWVELGTPVEEAEFKYYPKELYGLVKSLQEEVEKCFANNAFNRTSGSLVHPTSG
jgi:hypothetical protein